MTVLKDASEITRALTGLDRRYTAAIPDWEPIDEADLLGRAAVVCAAHAGYSEPDYAVDRSGWRPPVRLADGPTLPGLGGVLQAENNLLVRLSYQPDAYSLRLILDSQRIVSHHAANLAPAVSGHRDVAAMWAERAETYSLLVDQTRNLRGLVGHGVAAAQGALAASRIRGIDPNTPVEARALRHLDALFTHIDRRIADTIAAGADDRSYLMRIGIPRVDLSAGGAVKPGSTDRHGRDEVMVVVAGWGRRGAMICRTSLSGVFHVVPRRAAVAAGWSGREGGWRVADSVKQGSPGGLPGPGLWQMQSDPSC